MQAYKKRGFWIGLAAFFAVLLSPNPESLSPIGWAVAAVTLLMAIWWATEAVPVAVTALLPLALFPLLQVTDFKTTALPYANPNIYLFMGGFILALGIESSGLHKRLALKMLIAIGNSGARLIGGFMLVSASISMWVMNTSTTLMLLPIGLAVCASVAETIPDFSAKERKYFETSLLLGIAYAASIGGMSTLVGTAPNIIFVGFIQETYGIEISFVDWMKLGVPVSMVLIPFTWVILTRWVYLIKIPSSEEALGHLSAMKNDLGPITPAEKRVAFIFLLVVLGWVFRGSIVNFFSIEGISDTSIAIMGAIVLFLLPSGNKQQTRLLVWEDLRSLPWGVLILFGGGLSLASAISSSGLAQWLGEGLSPLAALGVVVMIFGATTLVVFLTEMTSNLATTATFLPVIGAMAVESGIDPMLLCIPITLAASCAFMLPVATAPNAIVFSSGKITVPQMARVGFLVNCFGILLITAVSLWWAPTVFG